MFFSGSYVRLAQIVDGTSHTLTIGERGLPGDLQQGWLLCASGTPLGTGNEDNHLSTELGLLPGTGDNRHDDHFWSWHDAGAHFLFADGSVRFLNDSLDRTTLKRLSTRSAHDVPGAF